MTALSLAEVVSKFKKLKRQDRAPKKMLWSKTVHNVTVQDSCLELSAATELATKENLSNTAQEQTFHALDVHLRALHEIDFARFRFEEVTCGHALERSYSSSAAQSLSHSS